MHLLAAVPSVLFQI